MRGRVRARREGETGSMSVELVLLVPAMSLFILLLVAAGRIAYAGNQAEAAASAAARAASLGRTSATAVASAEDVARTVMAEAGYECASITVQIDASGVDAPLGEVGVVGATVECQIALADLALPGLPGTKTFTTSAQSPVDPYRERR